MIKKEKSIFLCGLPLSYNLICFISFLFLTLGVFAGKPLRTDDALTIGKSNVEIELTSEFFFDKNSNEIAVPVALTYGLIENADFSISSSGHHCLDDLSGGVKGIGDLALELKYVFQNKLFDIGFKPVYTIPVGDSSEGFGKGKPTYGIFLLLTKTIDNVNIHSQLGYIRNNNVIEEDRNIWEASIGSEIFVTETIGLAVETGIARDVNPNQEVHPIYILSGLTYSLSDNFILDLGFIRGLNESESDFGIMSGFTWSL